MDDKIKIRHALVAILIGGIVIACGVHQGKKEVKAAEQKIDAQEKTHWDIEVKKMESQPMKVTYIDHWQVVKMRTSAYCPCKICCERWASIPVSSGKRKTASGHTINVGDKFVAAPRNYPFGTEMVIEGYAGGKIVKVEDVGGAIKDNKLDLYFDTHKEALEYGIKDVLVKVRVQAKMIPED